MDKLSYQLYSSRKFPPLEKTVEMLAEAGYKEVEGFGAVYELYDGNYGATHSTIFRAGLSMPTAHFGLDEFDRGLVHCMDVCATLYVKTVYCPYLAPKDRPTTPDGWAKFGERIARLQESVNAFGYDFGWHNHDFEFKPLNDGSLPIDHILGASDKLQWEADLAWIVKANADPIEYIKKYGSRITSVHVKDIAPEGQCEDEDGWADVGKGTMDWPSLLKALEECPVGHYILEHDNPSDDKRFAVESAKYLKSI